MEADDLVQALVTCRTAGCENADHPITVLIDPDSPIVICGPCSQLITDVTT